MDEKHELKNKSLKDVSEKTRVENMANNQLKTNMSGALTLWDLMTHMCASVLGYQWYR